MSDISPEEIAHLQDIGGGSLLIAWQLKNKNVLVVGGGEVASQRIESILSADAYITVLCPAKGLVPRTKTLIEHRSDRIKYYDRRFTGPAELQRVDMVLTAIDDVYSSKDIVDLCRKAKIPVNAADIPDCCDFYFGSQIRDGPLQVMISTNGNGPRIASLIKSKLQSCLAGNEGDAIKRIGRLREKLKERAPGVGGPLGRKRMRWMTQLCNEWDIESFATLDEAAMEKMLDVGWEMNKVPSVDDIFGKEGPHGTGLTASTSTATVTPKSLAAVSESSTPLVDMYTVSLIPAALGFVAGAIFMAIVSYRRK